MKNKEGDKPIAILEPNRKWCTFGLFIIIFCLIYSVLGLIMPVIKTGDYENMWVSSNEGIIVRIFLYYISIILVPLSIFFIILIIRQAGTYYFYNDYLILRTFWTRKEILIPYSHMYVISIQMGLRITKQKLPDWSHPLKRLKVQYWEGVGFGTNFKDIKIIGMKTGITKTWKNPEDGPNIVNILKEKAFSFTEKNN